jgi:hypothetical protein
VVFGEGEPPPFLRNWVSLRVDPSAEASIWTRDVLDALGSGSAALRDRSAANREERQKRLAELESAAQELRKGQPDQPPTTGPKAFPE